MKPLTTFGRFWYDFIVGDDWRLAVGVVGALTAGFFGAHHGLNFWWSLPLLVSVLLAISVTHAEEITAPSCSQDG